MFYNFRIHLKIIKMMMGKIEHRKKYFHERWFAQSHILAQQPIEGRADQLIFGLASTFPQTEVKDPSTSLVVTYYHHVEFISHYLFDRLLQISSYPNSSKSWDGICSLTWESNPGPLCKRYWFYGGHRRLMQFKFF